MAAFLSAIIFVVFVVCVIYAQFGAYTKRRYPRDKDEDQDR